MAPQDRVPERSGTSMLSSVDDSPSGFFQCCSCPGEANISCPSTRRTAIDSTSGSRARMLAATRSMACGSRLATDVASRNAAFSLTRWRT